MDKKKFLITGGHGKLGTYLRQHLGNISPKSSELDILQPEEIDRILKEKKVDGIIHLAAMSDQKLAEKERLKSYQINVIGTRNVADAAKKYGLKMFYTSTDYVFPGTRGNYSELDVPWPANWYGHTKYAGELEIMNSGCKYCIMRISFRPIKWIFPTAYTNIYTSADYVDVIAKEVALCISYELDGIIHIGTPKKSFYDLAIQRNPGIAPEECADPEVSKVRYFDLSKWLSEKEKRREES